MVDRTAALFDMDGVIVDNMAFHKLAWELFFLKHSPPMPLQEFMLHFGRTNKDLFELLFSRELSPEEEAVLGEEKEALYRDAYAPHVAPVLGFKEFLKQIRKQSVRTAVGTSAPRVNLDFVLDRIHIRPWLDVLIDSSDVTRGKPDPEIYLTAAKRLGCRPERCIVFEDSFAGIESGRNAGMKVIALATTHPRKRLLPCSPDLIIRDFTELDISGFLRLLA